MVRMKLIMNNGANIGTATTFPEISFVVSPNLAS